MMTDKMNPALQHINQEIDQRLTDYPVYPYQTALAIPILRQQILYYIQQQLQQAYPALRDPEAFQFLPTFMRHSQELRLRLESHIYWGIEYVIHNNLDQLAIHTTETNVNPEIDGIYSHHPSQWFG